MALLGFQLIGLGHVIKQKLNHSNQPKAFCKLISITLWLLMLHKMNSFQLRGNPNEAKIKTTFSTLVKSEG